MQIFAILSNSVFLLDLLQKKSTYVYCGKTHASFLGWSEKCKNAKCGRFRRIAWEDWWWRFLCLCIRAPAAVYAHFDWMILSKAIHTHDYIQRYLYAHDAIVGNFSAQQKISFSEKCISEGWKRICMYRQKRKKSDGECTLCIVYICGIWGFCILKNSHTEYEYLTITFIHLVATLS